MVSGLLFVSRLWLARLLFLGWRAVAAYQGQPLFFNLGSVTTHQLPLGDRVVELRVYSETSGDNGAAAIAVVVDGQLEGKLESTFNYDLLVSDHPGSYELSDVNDDGQADLLIHLRGQPPESYVLSSQDGKLYSHQSHYFQNFDN
ncbi:MAG: hypothetical protein AAF609_09060 [Cyanobacteria bacterium P01_C01_bin.120]